MLQPLPVLCFSYSLPALCPLLPVLCSGHSLCFASAAPRALLQPLPVLRLGCSLCSASTAPCALLKLPPVLCFLPSKLLPLGFFLCPPASVITCVFYTPCTSVADVLSPNSSCTEGSQLKPRILLSSSLSNLWIDKSTFQLYFIHAGPFGCAMHVQKVSAYGTCVCCDLHAQNVSACRTCVCCDSHAQNVCSCGICVCCDLRAQTMLQRLPVPEDQPACQTDGLAPL